MSNAYQPTPDVADLGGGLVKDFHGWTWQKETLRDGVKAQVYFCGFCDVFRISWRAPSGDQINRYRFKGEQEDRFSSVCIPDTDLENETEPA
jgi:hypothetical protein